MAFDLIKKLEEIKYELSGPEEITKTEAIKGLKDVLGIEVSPDVQNWMPDKIILRKLKIDRTTQPKETYELEMEVNIPPIFDVFTNIIKANSASFEVKTNQNLDSN